ncbi:MAG: transcription elongation factor GreA [Selenomonadales bacterium]|nr:transcription elongation factor GreA [Selenomonadales bacterium]MDD6218592.1 transcription elongation factor GreA [Selenomonadaceae bacterium]
MAEKEVILTQEGYDELVKLLDYKISVERKQVAERLNAAIALGDLSENSEYDDAKNQQAFLEGEIIDLQVKIRNAKIITKTEGDIVTLGSTVVIKDIELDEVETYLIVGSTEADPDNNKISNESPVGMAILNQPAGTIVDVEVPAGIIQYEILEIK